MLPCYEAFIHIVDSTFNQHAKWLTVTSKEIPWRRPVASLNYLLTSRAWRQDHKQKTDIIRVYLPPDANTLLPEVRDGRWPY